jgi:hypothetical protein
MGLVLLTERYADQIIGVVHCFDRLIFQGVLPQINYAKGMTDYFYAHQLLIKDFTQWAEPLNQMIRQKAEQLTAEAGLKIEYLAKAGTDKEDLVQQILRKRGEHPGLVAVFSSVERCSTYKPLWSSDGPPRFRGEGGRCLHYYFYLIDAELGLCFVRVPTWAPFRVEVYCNGHNWLAGQLRRRGIGYTQNDNAFTWIADPARAQKLAGTLRSQKLHGILNRLVRTYCPVAQFLQMSFRWTFHQAEFATDILFRQRQDLQRLYEPLTRTVVHAVKARDVATFLGKRLQINSEHEVGNRYTVRIEGTRVRHCMGPASIKIYDKFGHILRIETTINNIQFFPHYRQVEQRNGRRITKWTKMKKSIYSLQALQTVMEAANRRYLEFISALQLPLAGAKLLHRVCSKMHEGERNYRGLNFFSPEDAALLETLARGEFNLQGFRNKTLRQHLPQRSSGQISRALKSLRLRGLVKKVGHTYKYYLTDTGKQVVAAGLYLKQLVLIPKLAEAA